MMGKLTRLTLLLIIQCCWILLAITVVASADSSVVAFADSSDDDRELTKAERVQAAAELTPAERAQAAAELARDIAAAKEAVEDAIKTTEALRERLQNHVAAQVNKLLEEKSKVDGASGGQVTTQKLELKIDLPADLAALVNNNAGGSLKINGQVADVRESSTVSAPSSDSSGKKKDAGSDTAKGYRTDGKKDEGGGRTTTATVTQTTTIKTTKTTQSAQLCRLGHFSETGFGTPHQPCLKCPAGLTTIKLGSTGADCRVVTERDMLGMFFDVMNGETWDEHHRRGWKSEILPACEWEGISCTEDGEINGLAIPIVGMKLD